MTVTQGPRSELPAWTLKQPWATAVLLGKPVENRGRMVTYRGPFWLHAGARSGWDPAGHASPLVRTVWAAYARSRPDAHNSIGTLRTARDNGFIPFGAVIGQAVITGCHHASECMHRLDPAHPELSDGCSPWAVPGQFHTELTDTRPLVTPVACSGNRGLWRWLPLEVENECRRQLELAA